MMNRAAIQLAAAVGAAALLVVSGVWIVESEHRARKLFAELQELEREKDRLQVDWGRLQLEQSAWATHPRIEAVARDQLQLAAPADDQVIVVAEPGR